MEPLFRVMNWATVFARGNFLTCHRAKKQNLEERSTHSADHSARGPLCARDSCHRRAWAKREHTLADGVSVRSGLR